MKVLKYSIIAKLIIKKHKRDVEIIFSVIRNIKKIKRYFLKDNILKGTFPVTKASLKVQKQHCEVLTFEYPNMCQYSYSKMNEINPPPQKTMSFSIMQNARQSLIQQSSINCFRFSRPFFHHQNPAI